MEFSVAGLLVSLAILAPNLLLLAWPPRDQPKPVPSTGFALSAAERAGQAGCLVAPALTGGPPHLDGWLLLLVVFVGAYWALWLRYLLTGRRFARLYEPLGPIPVPMAVFPVLAFAATAGWLGTWWLAAATVVLAVGHLPTAWIIRTWLIRRSLGRTS
ncbi:hypothetical protein [Compostimonas suwonensis]|nr:hypothetical protein [Compostimonas suwonensis]